MESFNGHFEGEGHSPFLEAQSFDELIAVVERPSFSGKKPAGPVGVVPSSSVWYHLFAQ